MFSFKLSFLLSNTFFYFEGKLFFLMEQDMRESSKMVNAMDMVRIETLFMDYYWFNFS